VTINLTLFRTGLVLYALSFLLVAAADPQGVISPLRGYGCAYLALEGGLTHTPFPKSSDNYVRPFEYFSTLIAGLINPVFLVYVTLVFLEQKPQAAKVLRYLLLAMIPFCWTDFHFVKLYPREGHFVWVAGMLLVIFSSWKQDAKRFA
jgi:hypothetical protein